MTSTSNHLFVYGTLRASFSNPPAVQLRRYSRYVGEGAIAGQLYDIGSYPGALYLPDRHTQIHGSIYELFPASMTELLLLLDNYEGIQSVAPENEPDEYIRRVVSVTCSNRMIDCWVYLYNWPVDSLRRIESGDYVTYSNKKAGL